MCYFIAVLWAILAGLNAASFVGSPRPDPFHAGLGVFFGISSVGFAIRQAAVDVANAIRKK